MEARPETFHAVRCPRCGWSTDPSFDPPSCQQCGAMVEPQIDLSAVEVTPSDLDARPFDGLWRYAELLPIEASAAVSMGEGGTPLVDCPALADELGVNSFALKLEGHNPTGTFKDRGATLSISAAKALGVSDVALASAGNAGHAAAAYAARAGIDAHVFLPARASFTMKAMVNVHGGDLTVVEGRLSDAGRIYSDVLAEHDAWHPVATDDTPFRREGKKTMFYEVAEQRSWSSPDHIVYPTGGGVGLLGMYKAATELSDLGWIDSIPAFHAAQSTGCSPVVDAFDAGAETIDPVERPDTICGGIEVEAPGSDVELLSILRESGGTAVATDDDTILDSALSVAELEGIGIAPTAAAAVSGTNALVKRGDIASDDDVVAIATGTGLKEPDVLRGQLMRHGI